MDGTTLAGGRSRIADRIADRAAGWVVVAGPALGGLALFLWRLGSPVLWLDEATTVRDATRSLPDLLEFLTHRDAALGLYYVAMHAWCALDPGFGLDEAWLRLPSAMAMAAAIAVVADLARRWWGAPAAVAAGLAMAVSPTASRYAQEARPYAVAIFFAVAACWLLVRARDRGGRWWAGYAGCVALLGLTHLIGLVVVIPHLILVAWDRRELQRWCRWVGIGLVPCALLGGLAVAQRSRVSWIPDVTLERVWQEGYVDVAGGPVVLAVLAAVAVLGSVIRWRSTARAAPGRTELTLALWFLLPPVLLAVAGLFTPLFSGRYLVVCAPSLILLAASSLAGTRLARWPAVAVLVVAVAVPAVGSILAMRETTGHGPDTRAAARVIAEDCRPGDAVWQTVATDASLSYYLRGTGCSLRALTGEIHDPVRRVWVLVPSWQTNRPHLGGWGLDLQRREQLAGLDLALWSR